MTTPTPALVFADARDEQLAKSQSKQQNALTHFNHFLKSHCVQINVPPVTTDSIPYHGLGTPKKPAKKTIFEFWGKLMGSFFCCPGTEARIKCDPKGNCLAHQSATQCASSVEGFFLSEQVQLQNTHSRVSTRRMEEPPRQTARTLS